MGINFSVVNSAGDGGGGDNDAGGDGAQETEDDVPGGPNARHGEDREEGSEDHDHDIILVSTSPHKVTRQSVTPLSTSNRDVEAGSNSGSMATGSARAGGGSEAGSLHLFSPDRLKMTPSMMTAAAELLIQSTHTLLDCPNKSLQKTADPSDGKAPLECTPPKMMILSLCSTNMIKPKQNTEFNFTQFSCKRLIVFKTHGIMGWCSYLRSTNP